ncbi:MAG: MarR family transcriptional regulator [Candidatus Hydrogenedentes bacterium]|nr:MarR family transcriptional regulator [Candidatus Hydrogenedentota bacterium]
MSLQHELDLDLPFEDVRHEAVLNVVRTMGVLSSAGALLFRRFGLTEAQFNALFSLKYKDRDLTQSDLGKRLVVTRASITSVLDKLEAKHLVARVSVPDNRRIYHVELTEKGRVLLEKVEPLYRENLHAATKDLSEKQCRTLIQLLERIRARTQEVHEALSR